MKGNVKIPLVFCCKPSIFASIVLDGLLRSGQYHILAVIQSSRIQQAHGFALADILALLKTCGFRYTLYLFYTTLLYSFIGIFQSYKPVWLLARRHGIPTVTTRNINAPQSMAALHELLSSFYASQAQTHRVVCLTVMFNQKLLPELLATPQMDFINMHPGELPAYRGVDPIAQALIDGNSQLGIALHKTENEFDAGEIISLDYVKVESHRSLLWHSKALFKLGSQRFVELIRSGDEYHQVMRAASTQIGEARYYSWPKKDAIKKIPKLLF